LYDNVTFLSHLRLEILVFRLWVFFRRDFCGSFSKKKEKFKFFCKKKRSWHFGIWDFTHLSHFIFQDLRFFQKKISFFSFFYGFFQLTQKLWFFSRKKTFFKFSIEKTFFFLVLYGFCYSRKKPIKRITLVFSNFPKLKRFTRPFFVKKRSHPIQFFKKILWKNVKTKW